MTVLKENKYFRIILWMVYFTIIAISFSPLSAVFEKSHQSPGWFYASMMDCILAVGVMTFTNQIGRKLKIVAIVYIVVYVLLAIVAISVALLR